MTKTLKEEMLKSLKETTTTEELVFKMGKWRNIFVKYHLGYKINSMNWITAFGLSICYTILGIMVFLFIFLFVVSY